MIYRGDCKVGYCFADEFESDRCNYTYLVICMYESKYSSHHIAMEDMQDFNVASTV